MKHYSLLVSAKCALAALLLTLNVSARAQSEIYPQHFDLEEVTLLDSPFKTAMETNIALLLEYDQDRLMTPFIRQAGLASDESSEYYGWTTDHPSFSNWALTSWSLEGHVGGHYLSALALAYAACDDETTKAQLKERLDYCLDILQDCQEAFDSDTSGLYGFIGGQPINSVWTGLYSGSLTTYNTYGSWVPFYCEHKILAGLRDAWIYTDSEVAKTLFTKMCDWSVNVISNLTSTQMQSVLDWEHGGMNETLADAYRLLGDEKYLTAAISYSHQTMVSGMQSLSTTFLDGKHANTQVPKYIGFERIYQEAESNTTYQTAAHNFWQDVAQNRTVCIGGNSVSEYFLSASAASNYISNLDGPESCNTNNMLKLSEMIFDETHDASYVDFYEQAMWNHILSTQDPETGGYVYFTTLRPQGYRIYSTVNSAMWCCVGTGMENHSKYGHFIYTHSTDNETLYINLFTASKLESDDFALTQTTNFPYEETSTITIEKGGTYTVAIRHPSWVTADFAISVNGEAQTTGTTVGTASFVEIDRTWSSGDVITVTLPMELRYEECPNLSDYIAFKYGPILLAAKTTASSETEAEETGLDYEELQNEYAGDGRMDHAPGSMAKGLNVSTSALLIGDRSEVLNLITPTDEALTFTIDASTDVTSSSWGELTLVPFYTIHHARYQCYWYQQTEENYLASDLVADEIAAAKIEDRTIDFVATGEQQSEAGHLANYSDDSTSGTYNDEYYRDATASGYFEYTLETEGQTDSVSLMVRYTTADAGRTCKVLIDGTDFATVTIPSSHPGANDNGFYNDEKLIPSSMLSGKTSIVVRFEGTGSTLVPGLYYVRLLKSYGSEAYKFVASDWTTGDASRVVASNITADDTQNTLTVNSGTGTNNVCLMLDISDRSYTVSADQPYLIVKGTNLSTASGKSYLWWLNGCNKGTSIAPSYVGTASDGETVIAWDITASGIDDYCTAWTWNFCWGQTIFGLTSTTGTSVISHIGFYSSVESYLSGNAVSSIVADDDIASIEYFDLMGRKLHNPQRGINIVRMVLKSGEIRTTKILKQ